MKIYKSTLEKISIFWNKKIVLINDHISLLSFTLGIYGERFFLYVHKFLKNMSPEMFSFICILGSYYLITKIFKKF